MTYQWNPLWTDVIDDMNPRYVSTVRAMIMASINWMHDNPDREPEWRELRPSAETLRLMGVPPDADIIVTGNWEDMYIPKNAAARHWFRAIHNATGGGDDAPSAFMFSKAVGCGLLFKKSGWDEFNKFMLENTHGGGH